MNLHSPILDILAFDTSFSLFLSDQDLPMAALLFSRFETGRGLRST